MKPVISNSTEELVFVYNVTWQSRPPQRFVNKTRKFALQFIVYGIDNLMWRSSLPKSFVTEHLRKAKALRVFDGKNKMFFELVITVMCNG
jgi:hypothetical protein